jgi:hypothetical protein
MGRGLGELRQFGPQRCLGVELLVHKRLDKCMFEHEGGAIASRRDYFDRTVYPLLNPIERGTAPGTAVAGRKQASGLMDVLVEVT